MANAETTTTAPVSFGTPEQVWSNIPTQPITLHQELVDAKVKVHEETVTINKLWEASPEILRGHAHKWIMIDAQKRMKSNLKAREEAAKEGKELPALTTVQEQYDKLLTEFPNVQGVTSAAGTKKPDPVAALKQQQAEMTPLQKAEDFFAKGLIDEDQYNALVKLAKRNA